MLQELDGMIEVNVHSLAKKIEELDPSKTYYIYLENATAEEISTVKDMVDRATHTIPWTSPGIIVLNTALGTKKRRR